ncbi:hypothetical protein, conserved, partial [Eimeria maxima]
TQPEPEQPAPVTETPVTEQEGSTGEQGEEEAADKEGTAEGSATTQPEPEQPAPITETPVTEQGSTEEELQKGVGSEDEEGYSTPPTIVEDQGARTPPYQKYYDPDSDDSQWKSQLDYHGKCQDKQIAAKMNLAGNVANVHRGTTKWVLSPHSTLSGPISYCKVCLPEVETECLLKALIVNYAPANASTQERSVLTDIKWKTLCWYLSCTQVL